MLAPFAGVPGKLKTLIDRLTAARASNLDDIDTTVSSRAPSSTALSTATWTGTKAGYIDSAISDRASQTSLDTMAGEQVLNMPPTNTLTYAGLTRTSANPALRIAESVATGALTAATYVTVLNVTSSKGVVSLAMAYHVDATSHALSIRITVDGVIIREYTEDTHTTAGSGLVVIGGELCQAEKIPFLSSLKIEVKSDATLTSGKVRHIYHYWTV